MKNNQKRENMRPSNAPVVGSDAYIKQKVSEKRQKILNDIKTYGLNGDAKAIRLRSNDEKNCASLYVNVVNLERDGWGADAVVENLIYSSTAGAWSIAIERSRTVYPKQKYDKVRLQNRLESSVFFILEPPSGAKYAEEDESKSLALECGVFQGEGAREHSTTKIFESNGILAIVCPKIHAHTARAIFPQHLILEVSDVSHSLSVEDFLGEDTAEGREKTLDGPNYVKGIRDFIRKTGHSRFACHLTRLPTEEDVCTIYSNEILEEILIDNKANVPRDVDKALRRASSKKNSEQVSWLLRAKADINAQDNGEKRRTALHLAIQAKCPVIICEFMRRGAKADIADYQGMSAIDWAFEQNFGLQAILFSRLIESDCSNKNMAARVEYLKKVKILVAIHFNQGICGFIADFLLTEPGEAFSSPKVPPQSAARHTLLSAPVIGSSTSSTPGKNGPGVFLSAGAQT